MIRPILVLLVFLTGLKASAQNPEPEIPSLNSDNIKVRSGFLADSIRVGDETVFYVTATYPSLRNLIFPDTTFDFSPFEIKKKQYFPTRSNRGISYDSVLYYLTTYEVDSVLSLSLPVFEILAPDCTIYRPERHSIFLKQVIKKLPDTLTTHIPVRATVEYHDVPYRLNIQLIIISLGILLSAAGAVWFLFGKKIQRYYYLKRMRTAHQHFMKTYTRQVEDIEKSFSSDRTESALSIWKSYMEQLHGKPFRKLTAREILLSEKDEMLGKNLRNVDAAIYGHNTNVVAPLKNLQEYADQRFAKKVKEVKHE